MIWIDLENKLPTDTNIPGWTPWPQAEWDAWLAESQRLTVELARLHNAGQREARNALIDSKSAQWGKLKPWLSALSTGKCWFTEARDIASHLDVEHFRPKKDAKNVKAKERDGYWWLAFNYMNFRFAGNVPNRKKGTWFPLRYGSRCSTYQNQCEDDENQHFLDPTNAYDVSLLAFDDEGKAVPAPGIPRWEIVRVKRTVDRLKLTDHPALTEERRKIWQKTILAINGYYRAQQQAKFSNAAVARSKLQERTRELRELTKPTSQLSSVAKWCIYMRDDKALNRLIF